ncbi:hypothetical protein PR048_005795 [Dryococelus australis]|uniref:Uncharacterized protein n=1 Tax=Dryococelus australis TaxID=614101 RepID=A0ABQ9I984_9NEOP|nr:hypothetical protein PR048_005795 [Dryococelus australis]
MGVKRGEDVKMEQRYNVRVEKTADPRGNPQSSSILRHDSHVRKSGSDPVGNKTLLSLSYAYWSLSRVFIGCCPTPRSCGIRKMFPCKCAIGSEAFRVGLINCDPIEKSDPADNRARFALKGEERSMRELPSLRPAYHMSWPVARQVLWPSVLGKAILGAGHSGGHRGKVVWGGLALFRKENLRKNRGGGVWEENKDSGKHADTNRERRRTWNKFGQEEKRSVGTGGASRADAGNRKMSRLTWGTKGETTQRNMTETMDKGRGLCVKAAGRALYQTPPFVTVGFDFTVSVLQRSIPLEGPLCRKEGAAERQERERERETALLSSDLAAPKDICAIAEAARRVAAGSELSGQNRIPPEKSPGTAAHCMSSVISLSPIGEAPKEARRLGMTDSCCDVC